MSDFNIDDILDATLDDLADLPEFTVPPAGTYQMVIKSAEQKKVAEHPAVEVKFSISSTVELEDDTQEPVKDGTETSIAYMLDNEFGVGSLKKLLKPIGEHLGVSKVSEILEQSRGMEVVTVTRVRKGKGENAERKYFDIVRLEVL